MEWGGEDLKKYVITKGERERSGERVYTHIWSPSSDVHPRTSKNN
jgi:hypothetical protein